MPGKNLVFKLYGQNLVSAIEVSVFFNCQNFINRLISDYDFWNVDWHERKEQVALTDFLKKFFFGQMSHFGPKNGTSS